MDKVQLRTWLETRRQPVARWNLPSQTRDLIEAIYGSEDEMPDASAFSDIQQSALRGFWDKLRAKESESQYQAGRQLIPPPITSAKALLKFPFEEREEDDPTVTAYWRAKTRDILPSVSLICLYRVGQRLALDPHGRVLLENDALSKKPDRNLVKKLMGRVVTATHPRVVDFFISPPIGLQPLIKPTAWQKHGTLRYCRVAIFTDDSFRLGDTGLVLQLTDNLGLEVVSSKE